jgi:Protein of unknown function (DUF2505)
MKFEYRHSFDTSMDTLIKTMLGPDLAAYLTEKMTTIVSIETLERTEDDRRIERRVKYVPVPMIQRIGPKKITPESLQWIEESGFDKATGVMIFQNIPTNPKVRAKMTNSGRMEFRAQGANRCERITSGELKVKFPLLGRIAEGIIAKNAKKMLDEEAAVLGQYIRNQS